MSETALPKDGQFQRRSVLTIGEQGVDEGAARIVGLQIEFDIQRTTKAESDKASIKITNLPEYVREKFLKKGKTVILQVGYGTGKGRLQQLFWGQIYQISSKRSGADLVSSLELEDGGDALQQTLTHRSFANESSVYNIIKTLVEDDIGMGLVSDNGILAAGKGLTKKYKYGRTVDGNTKEAIRKLCKENNLQFYVVDRIAYVNPLGTARTTQVVPIYTPASGLLGTPYRGIASSKTGKLKKDDNPTASINAEVLLNPTLIPGGRMGVESSFVSGLFKIDTVSHRGSYYGNNWSSKVELLEENTEVTTSG